MSGIIDKFYNFMGLGEDEEEELQPHSEAKSRDNEEEDKGVRRVPSQSRSIAPVVSLASERNKKEVKVVVVEPKGFDEAKGISDHIKNRRQVIVNLENTDRDLAQRIIDFVSGTTYGLNGSMQKVGTHIFVFVPSNVDIMGKLDEQAMEDTLVKSQMFWANRG